MNLKIIFTGGGTAGHVTPNLALIELLQKESWDIAYMGSPHGIEKEMIKTLGIPYHAVSSGKLRRYFSLKTVLDPFKIILGMLQATYLLYKLKPHVLFSKGGFVAFPVVVGAWLNKIPVVAHESDLSPGLANRLSYPFINTICLPSETSKQYFKKQKKIEVTGTPIRQQLFQGDAQKGLSLCGFNASLPCLLIMGGSLGAHSINKSVRDALHSLLLEFQVIHICGKGKLEASLTGIKGYYQFEYVNAELAHLFACASIVVSRAGANSVYELLALAKPHVLIPLSAKVSRGDQIQNSQHFEQCGISVVVQDESLNKETLLQALHDVERNKEGIINKIKGLQMRSAADNIVAVIKRQVERG